SASQYFSSSSAASESSCERNTSSTSPPPSGGRVGSLNPDGRAEDGDHCHQVSSPLLSSQDQTNRKEGEAHSRGYQAIADAPSPPLVSAVAARQAVPAPSQHATQRETNTNRET